jgi:hypothetical protein
MIEDFWFSRHLHACILKKLGIFRQMVWSAVLINNNDSDYDISGVLNSFYSMAL